MELCDTESVLGTIMAETNGLQAGSDKGRMMRDQQDQEEQEAFLYCSGG